MPPHLSDHSSPHTCLVSRAAQCPVQGLLTKPTQNDLKYGYKPGIEPSLRSARSCPGLYTLVQSNFICGILPPEPGSSSALCFSQFMCSCNEKYIFFMTRYILGSHPQNGYYNVRFSGWSDEGNLLSHELGLMPRWVIGP